MIYIWKKSLFYYIFAAYHPLPPPPFRFSEIILAAPGLGITGLSNIRKIHKIFYSYYTFWVT